MKNILALQDEDRPSIGPTDKGKNEDDKNKPDDGLTDQAVGAAGESGALEEALKEGNVSRAERPERDKL